ncbi:MAG: SPOR domain-containing protein [Magnetococcales bacterium]|nr:SPOR domain-containing protein [Magnetococcales bacterium]
MEEGATLANEMFTIRRRLESGPSGELFLAQDRTNDALVVLKPLPESLTQDADAFFTRFKREFHRYQTLRHDRIAALHGHVFDRERQRHFLVRLHAPGITLEQWRLERPGGRLAWPDALAIGQKIAVILDQAHTANLSHRALKPRNVIIDQEGEVRLVDFGMAYAVRDLVHRLGGTLDRATLEKSHPYTAPEQFLLEHGPGESAPRVALYIQKSGMRLVGSEPGPAADIFALGVMLYELVTGRTPFTPAQIDALATAHGSGSFSGPGLLAALSEAQLRITNGVAPGPGVLPALNEARIRVFAQALHWRPEQRFARAGDFIAAFAPESMAKARAETPTLAIDGVTPPPATTSAPPSTEITKVPAHIPALAIDAVAGADEAASTLAEESKVDTPATAATSGANEATSAPAEKARVDTPATAATSGANEATSAPAEKAKADSAPPAPAKMIGSDAHETTPLPAGESRTAANRVTSAPAEKAKANRVPPAPAPDDLVKSHASEQVRTDAMAASIARIDASLARRKQGRETSPPRTEPPPPRTEALQNAPEEPARDSTRRAEPERPRTPAGTTPPRRAEPTGMTPPRHLEPERPRTPAQEPLARLFPSPPLLLDKELQSDRRPRSRRMGMVRWVARMSVPVLLVGGVIGASVLGWVVYSDASRSRPQQQASTDKEEMPTRSPTQALHPTTPGDAQHAMLVAAMATTPDDPNRVVALLATADRDLQSMRLVTQSGDQAIGRYQEVLRLDPGNAAARQGIGQAAEKYAQVAQTAMGHLTRLAVEGGVRGVPGPNGEEIAVAALRTELEAKTKEAAQERLRADRLEKQLQEVKNQMVRLAALEEKLQAWEADKRRLAELERQVATTQNQQAHIQELENRLESARVALERVNDLEKRLRLVQERASQERTKKMVIAATRTPPAPVKQPIEGTPVASLAPTQTQTDAMPTMAIHPSVISNEEGLFIVQLAAHRTAEKAQEMEGSLQQKVGNAAGMTFSRQTAEVGGTTWYRVRTGPFAHREGAEQALQAIKERTGVTGLVLRQGSW